MYLNLTTDLPIFCCCIMVVRAVNRLAGMVDLNEETCVNLSKAGGMND